MPPAKNLLIISGSPRANGCCGKLSHEIAKILGGGVRFFHLPKTELKCAGAVADANRVRLPTT